MAEKAATDGEFISLARLAALNLTGRDLMFDETAHGGGYYRGPIQEVKMEKDNVTIFTSWLARWGGKYWQPYKAELSGAYGWKEGHGSVLLHEEGIVAIHISGVGTGWILLEGDNIDCPTDCPAE